MRRLSHAAAAAAFARHQQQRHRQTGYQAPARHRQDGEKLIRDAHLAGHSPPRRRHPLPALRPPPHPRRGAEHRPRAVRGEQLAVCGTGAGSGRVLAFVAQAEPHAGGLQRPLGRLQSLCSGEGRASSRLSAGKPWMGLPPLGVSEYDLGWACWARAGLPRIHDPEDTTCRLPRIHEWAGVD